MKRLILSACLAVGVWAIPAAAFACESPTCPCKHHQSEQAAADKANVGPSADKPKKEKCKCTGASDCTCKPGECKCKKCGSDKVGFYLRSEPKTIVARDASAGFRI